MGVSDSRVEAVKAFHRAVSAVVARRKGRYLSTHVTADILGELKSAGWVLVAADAVGEDRPRRYACGVNADLEDTCERCPDPDGCIDRSYEDLRSGGGVEPSREDRARATTGYDFVSRQRDEALARADAAEVRVVELTRERDDAMATARQESDWHEAARVRVVELEAALREATHRMASSAGRLRLDGNPEGDYLAEPLPSMRAALAAAGVKEKPGRSIGEVPVNAGAKLREPMAGDPANRSPAAAGEGEDRRCERCGGSGKNLMGDSLSPPPCRACGGSGSRLPEGEDRA